MCEFNFHFLSVLFFSVDGITDLLSSERALWVVVNSGGVSFTPNLPPFCLSCLITGIFAAAYMEQSNEVKWTHGN